MNLITSNKFTMSSFDLWNKLNDFRVELGGSKIQHGDFLCRVEDECDDLGVSEIFPHPQNKQPVKFYSLNHDQVLLVGMRESKIVRHKVLEWIKTLSNKVSKPQLPDFTNPIEAARAWADSEEAKQKAEALVEKQGAYIERQTKFIDVLEKQHARGFTPPMFAREMNGVNCQQVQNYLANTKNWMRKTKDGWVATSYARDKYLSVTFKTGTDGVDRPLCELTAEGAAAMYRLYCKGELPMKKGWNGEFTSSKYLPILSN